MKRRAPPKAQAMRDTDRAVSHCTTKRKKRGDFEGDKRAVFVRRIDGSTPRRARKLPCQDCMCHPLKTRGDRLAQKREQKVVMAQ